MRVLFCGNFLEQSGWSIQQVNHILALDKAGVTVIPRNINVLNNRNPDLPKRIVDLMDNDSTGVDIIIQNVLPNMLEKTGRAKCVSYAVVETNSCKSAGWSRRLNLMDAVFVPNFYCKQVLKYSGVTKTIYEVPEAINIDQLNDCVAIHPIREQFKDKFIFLAVSEWTKRKNIEAIIRAFHTEFSPGEAVELVIKTTPAGMSNPQQDINTKLETIKSGLKLYKDNWRYKKENIICGFLSEADMLVLLNSADAYVSASRAEAFNISLAQSMALGKICIAPDHSGQDYVNDKNAYVVKSYPQDCFGAVDTLPDLYSAAEGWWDISIPSLRECMRSAYEKRTLNLRKQQQAQKDMLKYGLDKVGEVYRRSLEKLL